MLGASALFGTVAGFMVSAYTVRRMRPMIVGLEPTIQRITQREAVLSQARIFSRARITFFGLSLLALTLTMRLWAAGIRSMLSAYCCSV